MDTNGAPVPSGSNSLGPTILGLDAALFSLSTTIVIFRLITRVWITHDYGWDDGMIALAQAIVSCGKAFVIEEVKGGLGQHKAAVDVLTHSKFLKYDYLDWPQTFAALGTSKISICLFLLRLTQFHRFKHVLWFIIATIILTHVPFILLLIFQCNPIDKFWDEKLPGTCFPKVSVEKIIIVQGVFSILIDLVCASCPIIILHNAKIPRRTKTGLCMLMGLGFVTAIVCAIRTAFSYQVKSQDVSWVGVPNALSRIIEVNLGIIAACTPMMKPFLRYIRARLSGRDPHDILHGRPSDLSLSFWHASWWRDSSRSWRSGAVRVQGVEQPATALVPQLKGVDEIDEGSGRGTRGGMKIPSMVLGEPFGVDVPTELYTDPERDWHRGRDAEKDMDRETRVKITD